MTQHYSFEDVLARAERITWRVEDLIGGGKALDFAKPFMPETLARTGDLDCLSPDERLLLNQIRGHAYLAIFGLVEEFILPFVLDHARPLLHGEEHRARAFLEFASEEAKHIHLFRRFREGFVQGFGVACDVIGPPDEVARHVLGHAPLAVALLILHIEWMTQRHYLDSVRDDAGLDPRFKDLLLHHWMEEHQHAHLDTLMIETIAAGFTPAEIEAGIEGYLALGGFIDGALKQQVELDIASLERAAGRTLPKSDRERTAQVQLQANRWTYIGSGMTHPKFLDTLGGLSASGRRKVEELAPAFR